MMTRKFEIQMKTWKCLFVSSFFILNVKHEAQGSQTIELDPNIN